MSSLINSIKILSGFSHLKLHQTGEKRECMCLCAMRVCYWMDDTFNAAYVYMFDNRRKEKKSLQRMKTKYSAIIDGCFNGKILFIWWQWQ